MYVLSVQYFQGEACGEAGRFGEKVSETRAL